VSLTLLQNGNMYITSDVSKWALRTEPIMIKTTIFRAPMSCWQNRTNLNRREAEVKEGNGWFTGFERTINSTKILNYISTAFFLREEQEFEIFYGFQLNWIPLLRWYLVTYGTVPFYAPFFCRIVCSIWLLPAKFRTSSTFSNSSIWLSY